MRPVLFDVDGVIVHSLFHADPARRRRWDAHLLEDMGVDPEAFSALFDQRFEATITGKVSLVETLDAFLPEIGYRGCTMDFVAYWMERDVNLNYQLFEGIKRLRAGGGVKLYVATNQEHLRAHYLWSDLSLGHVFDGVLDTGEERLAGAGGHGRCGDELGVGAARGQPQDAARHGGSEEEPRRHAVHGRSPSGCCDGARRGAGDAVTSAGSGSAGARRRASAARDRSPGATRRSPRRRPLCKSSF